MAEQFEIIAAMEEAKSAFTSDMLIMRNNQLDVYHWMNAFMLDKYSSAQGLWVPLAAAILTRSFFQCNGSLNYSGDNFIQDNEDALIKTLALWDTFYDSIFTSYNNEAGNLLPTAAILAQFSAANSCPWLTGSDNLNTPDITANPDSVSTPKNTAKIISIADNDVFTNITGGIANSGVSIEITQQPAHGTLTVNLDKTVTYTPDNGYTGSDSFNYRPIYTVAGNPTNYAETTVSITVTASIPVANDFTYVINSVSVPGSPFMLGVGGEIDTDGQSYTVQITQAPGSGYLAAVISTDIGFTMGSALAVTKTVKYTVTTSAGVSNEATITVQINHPTANDFTVDLTRDGVLFRATGLLEISANINTDAQPYTVQITQTPAIGSLTPELGGDQTYNDTNPSHANTSDVVTVKYTITSNGIVSNEATITINITAFA